MNSFSLIAIPGWVEPYLTTAGAPLNVLLDIPKLSNILSKRDVAFYIQCQQLAATHANPFLIRTFLPTPINGVSVSNVTTAMSDLIQQYHTLLGDEANRLLEAHSLQNPQSSIRTLYDGQVESNDDVAGGTHFTDYTFEVVEVSSNVLGFKLLPVRNDVSKAEQELESFDRLLSTLSIYTGFKEAVKTPAMNRFIKLHSSRV